MRHRFEVAERLGSPEVPYKTFVSTVSGDGADASSREDVVARSVERSTVRGLFSRRIEQRVQRVDGATTATEIVSNSRRWYWTVWGGLSMVLLSRWFALGGQAPIAHFFVVLGLCFILFGTSTATPIGELPRQQMSLETLSYPQVGPLSIVWAGVTLGLLLGGTIGVASAGILFVGWTLHGITTRIEDRLRRVSNSLSAWFRDVPSVPSRYIFVAALAAGALTTFVLAHTEVVVQRPAVTLLLGSLVFGIVISLLWTVPSRKAARVHVVIAAGISGLFVISLPFHIAVEIRPLELQSTTDTAAIVGTESVLVICWGLVWYGLFASQNLARERFLRTGREITTEQAAVAAYLMIATAGALLVSGIAASAVLWSLSKSGISAETWLLAASLGMPAGYLVAGSTYQLTELASNVWYIRSQSDRSPNLSTLDLPFEPDYPIWVVLAEDFYAGAYWDPLDRAIVLSQGAIDELEAVELAAIIAHEESHFEHRGALLQFFFASLPAFVFMGKNVVYSIYDFYERELTADEQAVDRLEDAGISADPADVMTDVLGRLLREDISTMDGSTPTFLPTLQTGVQGDKPDARVDRIFEFFYGYFAGSVHPSQETRIQVLKRDDLGDSGAADDRPDHDH